MPDAWERIADLMMGSVCVGSRGITRKEVLARLRSTFSTEAALQACYDEGMRDYEQKRAAAEERGGSLAIYYPSLGVIVSEEGLFKRKLDG